MILVSPAVKTENFQQSTHYDSHLTTMHQIILDNFAINLILSWGELSNLQFGIHNVQRYQQ